MIYSSTDSALNPEAPILSNFAAVLREYVVQLESQNSFAVRFARCLLCLTYPSALITPESLSGF